MGDPDDSGGWEQRISRARHLAVTYPAAAEFLNFYALLTGFQRALISRRASGFPAALEGCSVHDLLRQQPILEELPGFLSWLSTVAPASLAAGAIDMRALDKQDWQRLVDAYLARRAELIPPHAIFVIEMLLQPLAEFAARVSRAHLTGAADSPRCPACGDRPVVGVLREEGHGARRSLICGFCATEWDFRRAMCPACGEERFEALAIYTSDQYPHVRIEACDTCRRYLKTVDLTRDGHAVPVVDDVATVSMDLWAEEQDYTRLRANLLTS
jgi:FdhE protein